MLATAGFCLKLLIKTCKMHNWLEGAVWYTQSIWLNRCIPNIFHCHHPFVMLLLGHLQNPYCMLNRKENRGLICETDNSCLTPEKKKKSTKCTEVSSVSSMLKGKHSLDTLPTPVTTVEDCLKSYSLFEIQNLRRSLMVFKSSISSLNWGHLIH